MNDYKVICLYKKGAISSAGTKELRKAGIACVAVKGEFSELNFRSAIGVGFADDSADDMQIMVLKAAVGGYDFDGRLGKLVGGAFRQRVLDAEKQALAAKATAAKDREQ